MLFCDHLNWPSGLLRHQNSPTEFLTTSFSFAQTWPDKFPGDGGWAGVSCGVGVGLVFEEADFTVTPLLQTNFLPFFWHV